MVYREEAYREVFPEVKIEKIIPKQPESMIEEEPEKEPITEVEKELEVEAPEPVQEGGVNDTGSSDTVN